MSNVANSPLGGTYVKHTITLGRPIDARIRIIAKRLNMPIRDVIRMLIITGLDCSQDLALTEKVPPDS